MSPAADGQESDTATAFRGQHCKVIAVHEVIPATIATLHAGDQLSDFALVIDTIDLPIVVPRPTYGHNASAYLDLPPNDLVVTLRRLVI